MRIVSTIAALALMATTATAGGLSDQIVEAPVIMEEPVAAGPSINPAFIVVGVLAALLIASAASDDDDGGSETSGSTDDTDCLSVMCDNIMYVTR